MPLTPYCEFGLHQPVLQARRKLCKLIVPKITMRDPCCDHQDVVTERNVLMILIAGVDKPCVFINCADFAKNYGRISLILQKPPDRRCDSRWRKHRCRDLIEQRLKEIVICSIDH